MCQFAPGAPQPSAKRPGPLKISAGTRTASVRAAILAPPRLAAAARAYASTLLTTAFFCPTGLPNLSVAGVSTGSYIMLRRCGT